MQDDSLTIGEFAQRSGLTARALRLYDDQGLLKPAAVDPWTGYRSYRPGQLGLARMIAALRQAGMPLAAIREVIAAAPSDAHTLVDRWWAGVEAEHEANRTLVPLLHRRIDGEDITMTGKPADTFEEALQTIARGDAAALRRLLAADPDLARRRGDGGGTLLAEAARALTDDHHLPPVDAGPGHRDVVLALLDAGADACAAAEEGWTPLHTAGISGHLELCKMLLAAGADRSAVAWGRAGATPLSFALFYGHAEAAEVLAADGPVPDDLRSASALGDIDRMRRFLLGDGRVRDGAGAGMDYFGPPQWFPPRARPVDDQTILDESLTWAARSGRIAAMELLVQSGAEVNSNPYRGTPLLWSIYRDDVAAARWLLDRGADPNLRHDFGGSEHGKQATALHLAAQYGCMGCLRLLLERGADPTITDAAFNGTALGWARHGEQDEAVAVLEAHLASR